MEPGISQKYILVVGLEVHAQLLTSSKIYAADSTAFGSDPNTQVSVISLGHPGSLPKLNRKAAEYAIRMGLACHSAIARRQIFDRKNYFYPDLPKGYQITQDRTPICKGGHINVILRDGSTRRIDLNRIHIEEDAGKSIHLPGQSDTLVDFNRAGASLIEIVTEPNLRSAEEAHVLLSEIRKLVRYLDICDGNMEEGSLRCDANVSVMKSGDTILGKKVEVKNMNSMRNVQRAIEHEFERQVAILESGGQVISETRTFDADAGVTHAMRTKEELNDYRYFPDPDLSPLDVSEEWLEAIKSSMPALPEELYVKYIDRYKIPAYDARFLTESKEVAAYFERVCSLTTNFKAASNWVMGPMKSFMNDLNLTADEFPVTPEIMAEVIGLIDDGKINFSSASRQLFPELLKNPNKSASSVAQRMNLIQDSNTDSLLPIVQEVIKEFPLKVEEYQHGKKGLLAMFMGEVMKRSKGKADPKVANELLKKILEHA